MSVKISDLTAKGSALASTDLIEIAQVSGGSYISKRVTGQNIIDAAGGGTVTSVDLTMPSAFTVSGDPITTAGTLAVAAAGVATQYIRGDGQLANFPTSSGGGASVSYYLNGSVSQGTFGGVAMREINKTPVIGAGTDFTIATNGYIQSFITDANDPNQLEIPGGNWNFETYFSASSSGGTPSFYVELYKWDGATLTLIASNSANPEGITNGTVTDLYVSALAVPQTTLALTDRLAVRIYVNNSGRTITLHTEDNNLSQIITTFSTGLTALNGITAQVQNLAVGTSGTDFAISSVGSTHTFNLPTASATNRGALSSADWTTFNNKVPTTTTLNTTSPLSGGGDLSANRTLSIQDAAADGTTKGAASFTASDFNATSGNISIDYTNGQAASSSNKGFLTSTDWSTFNNKANKSSANSGVAISFRTSEVYNSVASPGSGSITDDFSGSIIGVVQKIYHNDTSLVVPGNWIKLGSGSYTPSALNIIYCEWVSGTRVEYWIVKGS